MKIDKSLLSGSTSLLLLKLIAERDLYGYEMIELLRLRSNHIFDLKAGTLYPLLHTLEVNGALYSYDKTDAGRVRRYYGITRRGAELLSTREQEWEAFSGAVNRVLQGGALFAAR